MTTLSAVRALSLALLAGAAADRAAAQAEFIPLGSLQPGLYSQATALSLDGSTVVGKAAINPYEHRAFRWTAAGGMVNIDAAAPQWTDSGALGVSADGAIVTGFRTDIDYDSAAFRWSQAAGF